MIFTRVVAALLIGCTLVAYCPPAICAAAGHGHAAEEGPAGGEQATHGDEAVNTNPLEFQLDLALWTGVIFLLLLLGLWRFAWGPISRGLEKREQGIAAQIASAEKTNEEARELLEQYQQKLAQSQDEIRQMLDNARREAEKAGDQIVERAREEAQAEHQRAVADIELATADAIKELAERSATLAVDLAGKIVEARLDPKAHARLIEKAVADFSHGQPSSN